jgi:predicted Zn-dependent peptidase
MDTISEKEVYQKSVLDNGLRVITSPMPHTRSVCTAILVGTGSRYETPEEAGISHFAEHLCFKGTAKRPTSKEISETIEGVGGLLNGSTDKELTIYWCKVARPHFLLSLDLLVDMLRNSKSKAEDVEKERQVITEEINTSMDYPQNRVNMIIDEALWPDQALGRDVAGSKATVAAITRPMLVNYLASQYAPQNTVVSVAGDVEHEEVMMVVTQAFSGWAKASSRTPFPASDEQKAPQARLEQKATEQAHICLACPGLSYLHPDRFKLDLLNVVLGEGMSSRLFLEIREKRGLAYDIFSSVDHFLDSGALIVYAAVDTRRANDTIKAVLHELNRLKERIPQAELNKAKELAKGRLMLRMEDTRSVAIWTGGQELLIGQIRTVDEITSMIDAITAADLEKVARDLILAERLNLALVGPFSDAEPFRKLLRL